MAGLSFVVFGPGGNLLGEGKRGVSEGLTTGRKRKGSIFPEKYLKSGRAKTNPNKAPIFLIELSEKKRKGGEGIKKESGPLLR